MLNVNITVCSSRLSTPVVGEGALTSSSTPTTPHVSESCGRNERRGIHEVTTACMRVHTFPECGLKNLGSHYGYCGNLRTEITPVKNPERLRTALPLPTSTLREQLTNSTTDVVGP